MKELKMKELRNEKTKELRIKEENGLSLSVILENMIKESNHV